MPGIDFQQLRRSIAMAEVLELLGFVSASRKGDQVRGACPLHLSENPAKQRAFSAHLSRNYFQCFQCGASGNPLDLWAMASKQDLFAAALDLCSRLNKQTPWLTTRIEKRNP